MTNATQDSAPPPPSRLRHLWVVGVLVLIVVTWRAGWRDILGAMQGADPRLLGAVVVVEGVSVWVRAAKWRVVLGAHRHSVRVFFLSKAAGNWSPGRVGELSPLLIKEHRTARMGAWIVVDRLLEIGIDGLHPLDPMGGMALTKVREKVGDRLILFGNANINIPGWTPLDAELEARRCIEEGAMHGPYFLSSAVGLSHKDNVPPENIVAFYHAAEKYGRYAEVG